MKRSSGGKEKTPSQTSEGDAPKIRGKGRSSILAFLKERQFGIVRGRERGGDEEGGYGNGG